MNEASIGFSQSEDFQLCPGSVLRGRWNAAVEQGRSRRMAWKGRRASLYRFKQTVKLREGGSARFLLRQSLRFLYMEDNKLMRIYVVSK